MCGHVSRCGRSIVTFTVPLSILLFLFGHWALLVVLLLHFAWGVCLTVCSTGAFGLVVRCSKAAFGNYLGVTGS